MGLQKEKLIDTYEVTKVSKTTGEVITYDENVYEIPEGYKKFVE